MRGRRRLADVVLALAFCFCVAAVAYRVLSPPARPAAVRRDILRAGDRVPEFWRDLGWTAAPGGPTLLLFYTVECPWCRISVPRWNQLDGDMRAVPGGQVVAVALSDSAPALDYPRQTGLVHPVRVARDRNQALRRWKVDAVPYTVLVEPDGRVRGAWVGAVDSLRYDSIRTVVRRAP